ncbi:hypothetical protein VF14_24425 [Nostoc linckia z18]|uniref:DUF1003 domain-containing protein n=2 Tax=Nostoc linckia TaxID=92942 RepID=A0A9Q6EI59_NOSLI|nr:DUF1003 domain-containing protein [Nostoc linckia]PHK36996.1 hypothetical protein VF12_20570 [Nostoc linckia z15]PHK42503.1 hypothetical protein VF13_29525 [Nostoc linckia z16]PHJ58924.1 hypothetical protein VF02_26290 [Nostoc linckia z1]PHJ61743.1 hypothetical protein VF05_28005 [Nostoc linckia z3]PHJ67425.1 hypothetical protein VF03_25735 [Nostoc linckia z2]
MKHNTEDTANELKLKASRNQVIVAPLPDPIAKNIEAIISLHTQELQDIPTHRRILEAIATFFGRSTFLYSLLVILAIWIFGSFFDGFLPFHLPSFSWSGQGLDAAALVISTGVLVRQTRQENFAEQRAQLMLQLNLLSEQKIAKIIALLEELRTDLPNVINRHDYEAQLMQEPADPIAVLEALQKNLAEELSSTEGDNVS